MPPVLPVSRNAIAVRPLPWMSKDEPVSCSDIFALDLALEAERAGVAVDQIAVAGCCSNDLIELAENIRDVLVEIKQKLHADAAELGVSQDEVDAVFSNFLAALLGERGSQH